MKTSAIQKLRRRLAANQTAVGMWVTLESPSISEMAVAIGLDWIVIDAEHGHLDWKEVVDHIRATVRSDTVALVRLAENNIGLIKRTLDIGADGIVIPWMETAEQLREAVAYAVYPTAGRRGIGGERATAWGQATPEHTAEADDHVLVIPMIESVRGGRNIAEMVQVPGVEIFWIGPADYSSSAGFAGQWEGPGIAEQILHVKDTVVAAGKYCGVIATSNDDLVARQSQGFRLLGLGSDATLMLRSMHASLAALGRDRKLRASLIPSPEAAPLARPPESFRPDRPEVMNAYGSNNKIEIQPGVKFECLVGAHNQARNLTTGIVCTVCSGQLPYHTHPTSESITLLSGEGIVEVEGRRYRLAPLDNVTIPRGIAHTVINASADNELVVHIAFPTDKPSRDFVDKHFTTQIMPDDATGPSSAGLERVTRIESAPRCEGGEGASFVDYFNADLMPGLEMSGGYGLFKPGGRLPAHIHDFDESICIVEGRATCVVEGRRHTMSSFATALQPRGRVHYFANETADPMAMIWVYAGPQPDRIVVDERNATAEGSPWR
jgi:2-dehydro-3-deoxyglucarate aldolase/4-hydroxy-2-oxoheptanedioate aldolase